MARRHGLAWLHLFLAAACGADDGTDSATDTVTSPSGSGTENEPTGSNGPISGPLGTTSSTPTAPNPNQTPMPATGPTPVNMPQGMGGVGGPGPVEPNPEPIGGAGTPPTGGAGESGLGGSGDSVAGNGGAPATGGMPATGGSPPMNTGGAPEEEQPVDPGSVDCGPNGTVIENAGPQANRVNYVIVGDGYTEAELDTTFMEHIEFAMEKRFSDPIGQPYLRYRKFVNICALRVASQGGICGSSALGCCGDDQSRLANCNQSAARDAIAQNFDSVPDFDVDWNAVVLNGDSWWNTGSPLMLWSGGNRDAHGAALHEGGHGFHQLADEYDGTSGNCGNEYGEVNSTASASNDNEKWGLWVGFDQQPGTGPQDYFEGSRYCQSQQYRPSDNSMMNMLFGDDPDTAFNAVSREKMIMDIWRFVEPIDSVDPPEGNVSSTTVLRVNVVDPEVVNVNWTVDGQLVEEDGGAEFDVSTFGSGTYEVTAFAFDNAGEELVRYRDGGDFGRQNWERSQQEASWTVTVP